MRLGCNAYEAASDATKNRTEARSFIGESDAKEYAYAVEFHGKRIWKTQKQEVIAEIVTCSETNKYRVFVTRVNAEV